MTDSETSLTVSDSESEDAETRDEETSDSESDDAETRDEETSDSESEDAETSDEETSDSESEDAETSDEETSDSEPTVFKRTKLKRIKEDERIVDLHCAAYETVKSIIGIIDVVIFEYEAVLGYGERPAKYAIDCLKKLKSIGKKIAVTLSSTEESVEDAIEALKKFKIEKKDITTATEMIKSYLKENKDTLHGDFFLVGSKKLKKTLQDDGHKIITIDDIISETTRKNVTDLEVLCAKFLSRIKPVTAVILSEDDNFSMATAQVVLYIFEAFNNVTLITSTTRDVKCLSKACNIVSTKFLVDAIERWTNKKAINLGKPGKYMAEKLMKKYDISEPCRVLIAGYDIDTDVAFGLNNGCKTLLFLSGVPQKAKIEDRSRPIETMPDIIGENIKDLYERLCEIYE